MTQRRPLAFPVLIALLLAGAAPVRADGGVAGAFLAGRLASQGYDYAAASEYYSRALRQDPGNAEFLEDVVIARIAMGDIDGALPLARELDAVDAVGQGASMAVVGALAKAGDFDSLIAELDKGRSLGTLVDSLLRAWATLGKGQMSDAASAFDKVAADEATAAFGLYHKALALASVGDFEGADKILSGETAGPLRATRRSLVAHVEILSQLERKDDALALISAAFGDDPDPAMAHMRDALQAGQTLPFDVISRPEDGLAEVFFTIAAALNGNPPDAYALGYSRLAEYVRPGNTDAVLLSAGMLEAQGQFDLANAAYNSIARDDPSYHVAELGRANALIRAGRTDAAIEVLQQLAKSYPDLPQVWTNLGDTLRRQERFGEAAAAYDRAIATFKTEQPGQWGVYYARGISNEREKNWPAAEADFRMALKLQPDQPQVLNYLGYSYLEMKTNLDEALAMIERAVKAEPDSGYIVDSLGWAQYRLGRYAEAVAHMERAIELEPADPVVNDHLGDVYWAVGRKREAEFQWKRALSFKPETEAEAARIRRKLEVGLDAVLREEGSEPLSVSKNGD